MLVKPEAVQGKELVRHPAFRILPIDSVAFSAASATANVATHELVYLSPTESCFININAAATATSTYVAAGAILPNRLEEGDVIHVISAGTDGTLTISGAV